MQNRTCPQDKSRAGLQLGAMQDLETSLSSELNSLI